MKILIILTGLITISYCNVSDAEVERYTKDCVENLKLVGFKYDIPLLNYFYANSLNYSNYNLSFQVHISNKLNALWLQNYTQKEKSLGPSQLSVADIKEYINNFYETNKDQKFDVQIDLPKLLAPEEYCEKLKKEIRTSSFMSCITSWLRINIKKCLFEIIEVNGYNANSLGNLFKSYELSIKKDSRGDNEAERIVGHWKIKAQNYYRYHMQIIDDNATNMQELKIETWCTTYIKNILIKNPDSTMKARIQEAQEASCT